MLIAHDVKGLHTEKHSLSVWGYSIVKCLELSPIRKITIIVIAIFY